MPHATHDEVIAATRLWLRPVIHILLRSGITYREFAELSKMIYVEVATRHFGRRNRPTNVSRTAMLTGLTPDTDYHYRLALAQVKAGQPQKAKDALGNALRLNPRLSAASALLKSLGG